MKRRKIPTRCECPTRADHHEAGQCQGVPYYRAERNGGVLYVCPDCVLASDQNKTRLSDTTRRRLVQEAEAR